MVDFKLNYVMSKNKLKLEEFLSQIKNYEKKWKKIEKRH